MENHDWKQCCRAGRSESDVRSAVYIRIKSHSKRNKLVQITNGNGRKTISILHWNMGSRNYINKTDEARQLLAEKNPDILIVSEVNLFSDATLEQKLIVGYQ